MRRFAAHYLLCESGLLLKKGLAEVEDNGTIRFIDTKGELAEIEKMIFHSGMLTGAFEYLKTNHTINNPTRIPEMLFLPDAVLNKDHLTLKEILDAAIQLQNQHPQLNVPQILNKIEKELLSANFIKQTTPGLYLVSGLDLVNLRFTSATRLKKII